MTVALSESPILQFFNNAGLPNVGGSLLTQVGGVNYPTYQDAAGMTPLPNPIPLNSRGEVSNSSGVSSQLYLSPGVTYTFTLFDPHGNQIWIAEDVIGISPVAVGTMTDEKGSGGTFGFAANVDFTPGTSTTLTLSQNYGSASNLWVAFDDAEQGADQYSLGGTNNQTLTFNSPIPVGISKVFVKGGTSLTIGTPGSGTVTDSSVASGSKLYNRIHDFCDIRDFGALGTGGNDGPAIQNALNSGAGAVYVPTGTFITNQTLVVPADVELFGEGPTSIISPGATLANLVTLNGNLSSLRNLQLANASSYATTGVICQGQFWNSVEDCYISNMYRSVQMSSSAQQTQQASIRNNVLISQQFAVFIYDGGTNSTIKGNFIQGGTGVWYQKVTTQIEGLSVTNNKILATAGTDPNSGYGIALTASYLEVQIFGNIIDQVAQIGVYAINTGAGGTYSKLKISDNWVNGAVSPINIIGPSDNLYVAGNTITGATSGFGMSIDQSTYSSGSTSMKILGNEFFNNSGSGGQGDYYINGATYSVIAFNQFNSSSASEEVGASSHNNFFMNTYTQPLITRVSASQYIQNQGYVTNSQGTASITSGTTSVTVAHNCSVTPGVADFTVVPYGSLPSNAVGEIIIESITSSSVTFQCRNNPGTNPLLLAWKVNTQ